MGIWTRDVAVAMGDTVTKVNCDSIPRNFSTFLTREGGEELRSDVSFGVKGKLYCLEGMSSWAHKQVAKQITEMMVEALLEKVVAMATDIPQSHPEAGSSG